MDYPSMYHQPFYLYYLQITLKFFPPLWRAEICYRLKEILELESSDSSDNTKTVLSSISSFLIW